MIERDPWKMRRASCIKIYIYICKLHIEKSNVCMCGGRGYMGTLLSAQFCSELKTA